MKSYESGEKKMFRSREEIRQRLQQVIEGFRQKGAISPETALTIQELGLPPRFEEAMHRRLGNSGIFVETNGKYYLNEERLKQIQEQRFKSRSGESKGGGWNGSAQPTWFRVAEILLMLPIGLIIAFVLFYFSAYYGGFFQGEFLAILLIAFVGLTVIRILFRRARRRYSREHQVWDADH
ncbi:MAG: hypothetical protein NWE98_03585 [Candidatus Bathyarchaeota archaeon]|nr:hypothetical protein [Candidatus Bathyarchaeota archaeon]